MASFTYPTSAEIMAVEQDKLPRLVQDDPVFKFFPMRNVDSHLLVWEQLDNYRGLQQIRGLNGEPGRVKRVALNQYQMQPGVYGEFEPIDEEELTIRRVPGTFGQPVNLSDLVLQRQDKLLNRRLDRIRNIIWTLLTTGTFSVSAPSGQGGVAHTDTYGIQTFTAGTPWSTVATATPLADLRAVKLLARGHSVHFGAQATGFANQTTINNMLNNTNSNDLFGRRQNGLSTINNLDEVNKLLMGDDLPSLAAYDEGYYDDAGSFQLFIPNGKVVIIGKRPSGMDLGEYRFTRNAQNPDLGPGPYTLVIDRLSTSNALQEVPRSIEVHDGHNGGPVIYFPSGVVVMSV